MVRANPQYDQQADAGEWQDLRSELVALLDQVESQVGRTPQPDPAYHGLTERMRDLRHQVTEIEPETRHREALRSVQRAVAKFSDRDELAPGAAPANPRDTLESAIQQIRSRHFPAAAPAAPPVMREPARTYESPRFDELAEAVGGIAGRLERLESGLHSQAKGQSANVKEIAEQVGQLSQVVELLAGAVGETGQVKRLEGQIAGLAKLVAREPQLDVSALTRRLDDVSHTVAKLAELQKAYADRSDTSGLTQRLDDVTATVGRLADLQVQLAEKSDTTGLNRRLDDVTATVGRLADLQVQLASKSDNSALNQRLDEVTTTVGRLADLQGKLVDRADTTSLTKRLDDVTATVGKLADLQVQLVDKTDNTGLSRRLDDVTATVGRLADLQVQAANRAEAPQSGIKEAMKAIEDGVRAIYDRVDGIERQMAMPPAELEKITDELQRFASAMKAPQQPQGLIELIDALNQRISDIERSGPAATVLKADVEAMRSAVVEAMEPRFAAIETQLGAISDKVANPPDLNIGQLEAQVRQLVARMDQTGEQLTGLAKLYSAPADGAPDFDALADKVAERTSAALADRNAPRPNMGETEYAEIEKRLGNVMQRVAAERPADDNSALEATIREVNDRLARLELSVAKPAPLPLATTPAFPAVPAEPVPAAIAVPVIPEAELAVAEPEDEHDPIAPLLAEIERGEVHAAAPTFIDIDPEPAVVSFAPAPELGDVMPANPAEEVPLFDKPFVDPNPLQRALEAKNGPRRRHPGMAAEPLAAELPPAPVPSFDFADAEPVTIEPIADDRPLPPLSSLDDPSVGPLPPRPSEPIGVATTDRNTFIAAARRAAMRQSGSAAASTGPAAGNSLIARAFARFQATRAADTAAKATTPVPPPVVAPVPPKAEKPKKAPKADTPKVDPPKADKPKKEGGFRLGRRALAGDKEPTVAWAPDEEPRVLPAAPEPHTVALDAEASSPAAEPKAAPGPGLITRYRTLILGVILLLALVAMANLLIARMQNAPADPAPQATNVGDAALSPTPLAEQVDLPTSPVNPARVIPMSDTLATASIDPGAAQGFTAPADQPMPAAVDATDPANLAEGVEPLGALESPVKVELPPDNIGPLELRQAAANGDARAQFEVAAIYTEGRAVPEDLKTAAVWYERSASQGFAPAQYRLGNLYEAGKGVDKDLTQARIWYQQAAEAGNRMAMHNLAALYASGGLGTQQFDSAAKWFEEAANRGMKDSQFNLGMLYARGLGVKQDLGASFKWFALAATRGDADAGKARDDVAKSLDAASVQRLNDEVAAWKPAAIDLAANFAPIGTWMKNFDPGAAIAKLEVVKGVQQVLSRLGYDVGTPDGLAGPKTAEAIKAFERGTGMNETGTINPRLLAVLGSQPV
jgi:localization factor PodJL